MSEPTLVFKHGNVEAIEAALAAAAKGLREETSTTFRSVNDTMGDWAQHTISRVAEQTYQTRLNNGVGRLATALDDIQKALAEVREKAHDLEVENVAIVG